MQVQVDERGIMNVEGWPETSPNEKFEVSVDPTQSTAANDDSNRTPCSSTEFNQSEGDILDVQSELTEMKKNFSHYMKTDEFNRKKVIDKQVTRQQVKIVDAANAEEFIRPLLDNIDYVNNYGKGRTVALLGDLANRCSDT